ncbi:relaxase/mobilization nuclease domain-containing protein [Parabacteroides distasonis]|nr:relaxase/mobilization nuclease domain-containing protein [Parabacteroides distasonis]
MTDADWAKLGNDFMQRMGLMNHQYIIVKHSGTEKNRRQAHLHILANRVSLSGELYQDNWIGKRATEAANSIARERNLVQSKDIGKANREEIKQAMDDVLIRMQGFDLAGFSQELGKLGFKVREAQGKYRQTQRLLRESPERNGIQGKRDRERLYACPYREDTEKIEV